jgi:hypothetical protein
MIIKVKNWQKYNGRADVKVTSWIRFQNDFFTDPVIFDLSSVEKLVFIYCLCVRSKQKGDALKINTVLMSNLIRSKKSDIESALNKLISLELLEHCGSPERIRTDTDVYDLSRSDSCSTDGTDGTDGTVLPNGSSLTAAEFMSIWNFESGPMSKIKSLTSARRLKIKTRLAENSDSEYWRDVIRRMAKSDFMTGASGWKANFDWLIKNPENHVKVSEGNYDNAESKKQDSLEAGFEEMRQWAEKGDSDQ